DHRILPLEGDSKPTDPLLPVRSRAILEFAARTLEIALERSVPAEHHRNGARQHERRFAIDVGKRRIGGEPDRLAAGVADVIAAERALHARLPVAGRRAEADGDARQTSDRLDDAHELRRAEGTAEILE